MLTGLETAYVSYTYVRALPVIVCILLLGVANRKLAKKMAKIVTAAYLSNDNSKTKGVSTLNQDYPSEGIYIYREDGSSKPSLLYATCSPTKSKK